MLGSATELSGRMATILRLSDLGLGTPPSARRHHQPKTQVVDEALPIEGKYPAKYDECAPNPHRDGSPGATDSLQKFSESTPVGKYDLASSLRVVPHLSNVAPITNSHA